MLGKDHINISIAIVFPFLIPLFFLNIVDTVYIAVFMIVILIGSLIPDSDCGGKATIYYRFKEIDWFMKNIVAKPMVYVFNHLINTKKIKVEHEVKDEHRGIIHSPIGVLFSSLILMIPVILFGVIFNLFNIFIILTIFFGLIIGQLLHLFEDSCTISGINWGFPFATKEKNGKIRTFSKDPERKDIRPIFYAFMFYTLSIILAIGFVFDKFQFNIFIIYSIILLLEILFFILINYLSQSKSSRWMIKKKTINAINRTSNYNQSSSLILSSVMK